ncbi:hypothetical protein CTEN210_04287 [Chaetoceros tenuissimus]|uniref:C2 domain-containing protein n=1 Tax=Chaetoceros tenuissimus TaxID=426638 RepID=A0AAD3CMT2_9STRA|nr:hypothetical protein CTEN210_04287 [Chaetoceros tenuissimus]
MSFANQSSHRSFTRRRTASNMSNSSHTSSSTLQQKKKLDNPFGVLVGTVKNIYACTHLDKRGLLYITSKAICHRQINLFGRETFRKIIPWTAVLKIDLCHGIDIHATDPDGLLKKYTFTDFQEDIEIVLETMECSWKDRDTNEEYYDGKEVVDELCQKLVMQNPQDVSGNLFQVMDLIANVHSTKRNYTLGQTYLMEVVSVSGLENVECFVEFHIGNEFVHATKAIRQKLDPCWTCETGAFFLLDLSRYSEHRLLVDVKRTRGNRTIGQVTISQDAIVKGNGNRVEFHLCGSSSGTTRKNSQKKKKYLIALRYREATESDIAFIQRGREAASKIRENFHDIITPYRLKTPRIFQRRQKIIQNELYFLALPQDDEKGEQWFTEQQLHALVEKPSEAWTTIYSDGDIGKVYIEILSCENLPAVNLLKQPRKGNPFVTIVHENSVATTDAIPDCANPRFLPWSRRAFKLRIKHTYSPLFLGVHDWSPLSTSSHFPLGRIAIRLNKFKSNTTYNLSYALGKEESEGVIKIRLRIEWRDERKAILNSVLPPSSKMIVNVDDAKDFSHTHFTVNGAENDREFDPITMYNKLQVLYTYHPLYTSRYNYYYEVFLNGLEKTLRWQKGVRRRSLLVFATAVILVEYPMYTLPILSASLGYAMLLFLKLHQKRPSPWSNEQDYLETLCVLLKGTDNAVDIKPNANAVEDSVYMHKLNDKLQKEEEIFLEHYDESLQELQREQLAEKEWIKGLNENQARIKLNPMLLGKKKFHSKQLLMDDMIQSFSFAGRVLSWEHPSSFFITTFFFAFAIFYSFALYSGIILWLKRILVWTFLGPWFGIGCSILVGNKSLVDITYKFLQTKFTTDLRSWKLKREENLKAVAMKKYMFGSTGIEVPDLYFRSEERAMPLIESSAIVSKTDVAEIDAYIEKSNKTKCIIGQGTGISGDNLIPSNYLDHVKSDVTAYKSTLVNDPASAQEIFTKMQSFLEEEDDGSE